MALKARIDQIKTEDIHPIQHDTSAKGKLQSVGDVRMATHVCRLTGTLLSAGSVDGFRSILNAGGSDAKYLLASKLKNILDAFDQAGGVSTTAIRAVISGTGLDPANYSPGQEITDIASTMVNSEQNDPVNTTGHSHK